MQVIVLDKHLMGDGRIERHIKYLLSQISPVIRIHFNRSELALSPGPFSQFGEKGYRINIAPKSTPLEDNPLYFNFFCSSGLIVFMANKAMRSMGVDTTLPTISQSSSKSHTLQMQRLCMTDMKSTKPHHPFGGLRCQELQECMKSEGETTLME